MIIIYGTRMYGRVDACGGSYLATRFVHLWYLPIVPIGSNLVLETNRDGSFQGIPVGLSWRSVLAGYLRVWGIFGILACGLVFFANMASFSGETEDVVGILLAGLLALASVGAVVCAFAYIGKLSPNEKRQRSVYAHYTGIAADPAELQSLRPGLRDRLLRTIVEQARGLAATGYRVPADPTTQWGNIALDPTVEDPELFGAAFTLARLEWSLAQGSTRAELHRTHRALWHRIRMSNPTYATTFG